MAGYRPKPKSGYSKSPGKGTKARQILIMALRPQGLTTAEAVDLGLVSARSGLHVAITRLRDYGGWDIRGFELPADGVGFGRRETAYKVIGRYKWDGGYVQFYKG